MTLKEFLEIQEWLRSNQNITVELKRTGEEAEIILSSRQGNEVEFISIGISLILDSALN